MDKMMQKIWNTILEVRFAPINESSYDDEPGEGKDSGPIEAYGVMGMKSKPWRKKFKNMVALDKWADDHDAFVKGTRKLYEHRKPGRPQKYKLKSGDILTVHPDGGSGMDGGYEDWTTFAVNGKTIPWKEVKKHVAAIENPKDKREVQSMLDDMENAR